MGMNGEIVLFPTDGSPPEDPDMIARNAIATFERLGFLLPDTANSCEKPKPWLGRFSEARKTGEIQEQDYALYIVRPDRILAPLRELVFVMNTEGTEEPGEIELPYVEFSVIKKKLPVTSGYDGTLLGNTWATIEFSYEDVRYDPEIHRIRNQQHKVFEALAEVFGSSISWGVDIG